LPQGSGRDASTRQVLQQLGQLIVHRLGKAQAVHASALLAMVLLSRREGIVSYGDLLRDSDRLLEALRHAGAPLAPALRQIDSALRDAIALFQTGNLLKLERMLDPWGQVDPWSGVLTVDPQRRPTLDYYRNNALHHLAPLAMLTWSLEVGDGEWTTVEREFSFLWELLHREFQHAPGEDWRHAAAHAAQLLERKRMLEREAERYRVPERARRTLVFFRQLLAPTIESYRTTLRFLALIERGGLRPGNQLASLIHFAQLELRRQHVYWPESISTENYASALAFYKAHADRGFDYFHHHLDALALRGAPPTTRLGG
jgi:glycerol-3-phosphate O-acyltransferase